MSPRHDSPGTRTSGEPDPGGPQAAPPTAVQFHPPADQAGGRPEATRPLPVPVPPAALPLHPATAQYVPYSATVAAPVQAFAPWTAPPAAGFPPPPPAPRRSAPAWGGRRARIEELENENAHLHAWIAHLGGAEPLHLLLETDRLRRELAGLRHAVHTARAELASTRAVLARAPEPARPAPEPEPAADPAEEARAAPRTPSPFLRLPLPSRRRPDPS